MERTGDEWATAVARHRTVGVGLAAAPTLGAARKGDSLREPATRDTGHHSRAARFRARRRSPELL